ncbi:MAG: hypothetical protein ACSHYB_01390 [Roseibacillus sp.]
MTNNNNDHQDILAAIAHAAENFTPEPTPQPQTAGHPATPAVPAHYSAPAASAATTYSVEPTPQTTHQIPVAQPQAQSAASPAHGMPPAHAAFSPTGSQQTNPFPLEEQGPSDEEMREVFAERKKKKFKLSLAVNLTLLTLLALPCLGFTAWYQSSAQNQAAFAELLDNFREVPSEVKSMATITDTYQEALAEVGAHGTAIDDATRALGVDPEKFETKPEGEKSDDATFLSEKAQRTALNEGARQNSL